MIKELILTTMFSFAPLINGVCPSKTDVFFSSSDSETNEDVVTLDDGKTYRKVYDGQSNDVNSNSDLIEDNYYRLNFGYFSQDLNVPLWDAYQEIELTEANIYYYDFVYNQPSNVSYLVYDDIWTDVSSFSPYLYYEIITSEDYSLNNNLVDFNGDLNLYVNYSFDNTLSYEDDILYLIVQFNDTTFDDFLSDLLDVSYFYAFFENAGANLPYHYEEIVKGHTLFDIINDWYLSLFSNETLDSYKFNLFGKEVSMTQYLCNVATIITLVSLVIAVVSITIFIFKLSAGLFKW